MSPGGITNFRCPLDPNSVLDAIDDQLVCQRCRLAYPVYDGVIPRLLPEEATLPPGCASLDDLPCQREGA